MPLTMSDRKKRVPETPESKLARQLRLGIIPKVLRAAPVVTPPAEKTYKRSFEFRAETEAEVREVVAAISSEYNLSDEKIEPVTPTQGNLPKKFPTDTQEYWKCTAALEPIVSAESPEEMRQNLRAEFNATVRGNISASLPHPYFHKNSGAAFTVKEVLQEVKKAPPPPRSREETLPRTPKAARPVARKQPVREPTPQEQWGRDAAAIARELIPLFSQKELPSDTVVRFALEKKKVPLSADDEAKRIGLGKQAPYQFELIMRGGDEKQHQAFSARITNHFFGTQKGEMGWIDAPGARAAAKKAAPMPVAPRNKLVRLLRDTFPDSAPASVVAPEVKLPQISESRFTLDRPFAKLLLQHLDRHYQITHGDEPNDFRVGSAKTPENDRRAIRREFWEAIGESSDTSQMAGGVLRKIAVLSEPDQQLLIALAKQVDRTSIKQSARTAIKIELLERGLAYPQFLRDKGIPREVFMEIEEADFLAEAKKYHRPTTTVGSVEHQNPPSRTRTVSG